MAVGIEKKLERRASVLATARRLIAERGYHGVTIRDLARECSVTVGTLYNRFESKDKLLAMAVEELFRSRLSIIQHRSGSHGHEFILATAQISADVIESDPRYSRAVVKGVATLPARSELVQIISNGFHAAYVRGLEEMREDGELADWVEVHVVADMIHGAAADADRRWANSSHHADWLRRRAQYAVCVVLLGVAQGTARQKLEARARALHIRRTEEVVSTAS